MNKKVFVQKPVRNGVRYRTIIIGSAAALALLLSIGAVPHLNPIVKNQLILAEDALNPRQWRDLLQRHDIILGVTWFFVTSGATTTLPSDFNTANNTAYVIGAGFDGHAATATHGGHGGGGGASTSITNYSVDGPGAVVNIQVGSALDTWLHDSSTLFAPAAAESNGGASSNCIPTTGAQSGGNGASAGVSSGASGGGGAGLANASGGANGTQGTTNSGAAGGASGGAAGGGSGSGAAGGTGSDFDATHGAGGGGAGGDANGAGGNGGLYGGGGGGAGSPSGTIGAGGQGLIALSYTPLAGTPAWFFGNDSSGDVVRASNKIIAVPYH